MPPGPPSDRDNEGDVRPLFQTDSGQPGTARPLGSEKREEPRSASSDNASLSGAKIRSGATVDTWVTSGERRNEVSLCPQWRRACLPKERAQSACRGSRTARLFDPRVRELGEGVSSFVRTFSRRPYKKARKIGNETTHPLAPLKLSHFHSTRPKHV